MELLSTIRGGRSVLASASVSCKAALSSGRPSARNPCLVLSQNDRRAPAARKRALSVPVSACVSQLIAQTCSSGAQPEFSPFCAQTPCPYWVIFPAIQVAWGKAEMTAETSCVFPMVRVCPPTTIMRQWASELLSLPAKLLLYSFDACGQFREPGIPNIGLFELADLPRRCPPNGLPTANGFARRNARLRASNGSILQSAAICYTHLPAHTNITAKHPPPGHTPSRRDYRLCPDLTVVPHMDKIVQLHAFRNAGGVQRTATH